MLRKSLWSCALVLLIAAGSPVAVAGGTQTTHPDVTISADKDFTPANGVRSGDGTKAHPYVISGWQFANLTIQNTDKWVTIHDNAITGLLVLDWIGGRLDMQHNTVNNLRSNQNVARTGLPTNGVMT